MAGVYIHGKAGFASAMPQKNSDKKALDTTSVLLITDPKTFLDEKKTLLMNQIQPLNLAERTKQPMVVNVTRTSKGLCYTMDNGVQIERRGGSIAWRNNNPGCIRYSPKAVEMGAIGMAYGFAVFPDEETGIGAIEKLLQTESYRNLSISGAINRYAPPHENNTTRYIKMLCKSTGVSRNTKLCDLNAEQLQKVLQTIRQIEGWVVGVETRTTIPMYKWYQDIDTYAKQKDTLIKKSLEKTM